MKALKLNELRVGNWISVNDDGEWSPQQVTNIITKDGNRANWVDCDGHGFILDDMGDESDPDLFATGIPLDETVLAKCGFEDADPNMGLLCWGFKKGQYFFSVVEYLDGEYGLWYLGTVISKGLFLHTLQNAIHIITGQELTYTP